MAPESFAPVPLAPISESRGATRVHVRARSLVSAVRGALLLAVLPAVLIGPSLTPGRRFLPLHPVCFAPLSAESPNAASRLWELPNYLASDRIFPLLSDQMVLRERALSGALATWEPAFGLGAPLFAGTLAGALYPPNWLAVALEPDQAAGWCAILSLVLAGLGMRLFLERRGLSAGAVLVGVLAYQGGGYALANLHYPMKVDAALWLPWSLWAIDGLAQKRRGAPLALSLSTALSFLAGFPPVAVFALAGAVAYALFRWVADTPAKPPSAEGALGELELVPLRTTILCLILGLLAASVQVLPTVEAWRESKRGLQSRHALEVESLVPATALTTIVPELFGTPQETIFAPHNPTAWWLTSKGRAEQARTANTLEWNLFAGALVFVLAIVAIVTRWRDAVFPTALVVLVFAFAQGWPGFRWLYALPGLNLGSPARAASVAWTLWPWLAALGAQALLERRRRALETAICAGFALAAVGFAAWTSFDPTAWAENLAATLERRYDLPAEAVSAVVRPEDALVAGQRLHRAAAQLFAAGASALAAALSAIFLAGDSRRGEALKPPRKSFAPTAAFPAVIFACAMVGILGFSGSVLGASDPSSRATVAPPAHSGEVPAMALGALAVAALAAGVWRGRERVSLAGALPFAAAVVVESVLFAAPHLAPRHTHDTPLFPPSPAMDAIADAAGDGRVLRYDTSESGVAEVEALARPNLPHAYGIADLSAYIVFTPRRQVELFEALDPRMRYRTGISRLADLRFLDHPILDLARVTAIVSKTKLEHPRLEPVFERAELCVYRRTGALAPARLVAETILAPSDEVALGLLASRSVDLSEATVLAPGSAPVTADFPAVNDPRAEVLVDRPATGRVDVRVRSTSGGWLVVHDAFFPGWKAEVNGRPVEIARADHAFRAVPVPPGVVSVSMWYEPWSLWAGAALSGVALALALWLGTRPMAR